MPRKAPLRSVAPDEKPLLPSKPKTVSDAADNGTTRELLVAMRTRIAEAVEDKNTAARDLAALTKRLVEVVRDIEAIDARGSEESADDDVSDDAPFNASAI